MQKDGLAEVQEMITVVESGQFAGKNNGEDSRMCEWIEIKLFSAAPICSFFFFLYNWRIYWRCNSILVKAVLKLMFNGII